MFPTLRSQIWLLDDPDYFYRYFLLKVIFSTYVSTANKNITHYSECIYIYMCYIYKL